MVNLNTFVDEVSISHKQIPSLLGELIFVLSNFAESLRMFVERIMVKTRQLSFELRVGSQLMATSVLKSCCFLNSATLTLDIVP